MGPHSCLAPTQPGLGRHQLGHEARGQPCLGPEGVPQPFFFSPSSLSPEWGPCPALTGCPVLTWQWLQPLQRGPVCLCVCLALSALVLPQPALPAGPGSVSATCQVLARLCRPVCSQLAVSASTGLGLPCCRLPTPWLSAAPLLPMGQLVGSLPGKERARPCRTRTGHSLQRSRWTG